MPLDAGELYVRWNAAQPGASEPLDPFDGTRYGYEPRGTEFILWSVGPDDADDEIIYDSRIAKPARAGGAR